MQDQFKPEIDYNKILFWVLLLYLVWQIKRGWDKSKTQVYSENAGSDLSTQQAIQLRQAMNPSGSGWLMDFDGTDFATITTIAGQISSFADVSQAYRALYDADLTADLTGELDRDQLTQFWALINGSKPATTTTGGTTTSKPATTTSTAASAGKTVTATTTANIRIDKAPYGVESDYLGRNKQATKGQVLGKYVSEKILPDVPNKGNRNTFVRYAETSLGGLVTSYYWIVKTAVSIK